MSEDTVVYKQGFHGEDEINALLEPAKKNVNIRPMQRGEFSGVVNLLRLNKIGIFSINSNPFSVLDDKRDYFGLTFTMSSPFYVKGGGAENRFTQETAHILNPEDRFSFRSEKNLAAKMLIANMFIDDLNNAHEQLFEEALHSDIEAPLKIDLVHGSGKHLLDSIKSTLVVLRDAPGTQPNAPSLFELEDDILFHFISSIKPVNDNNAQSKKRLNDQARLKKVEEFLIGNIENNITRAELCRYAQCSIRTVSRLFQQKHGCGPMEFLRMLRLQRVNSELLLSNPETDKVFDIALRYGFYELGKFSGLYKNTYMELPSQTLRR